ncbi:MAG TPA: ThiF family adenylyltransferase, partial [Gammaproteobacteria bacterium]|nr:ThiF family adenylyltransferase [Gammaproteobacteria bacterium]
MTPLQQEDLVRYSRHLSLDNFTNSSQLKINQSSILIVGIGGLGTITALYLANSGVGNIILNDFDSVDLSNLPRQILFNKEDINKNKADVAVEKLRAFNTAITLRSLNNKLSETELSKVISNVDI